jgi:hypothetical protein
LLCDYTSSVLSGPRWNEEAGTVQINRTEALDQVHNLLTSPGRIILPRRNSEIDEFCKELTNMARVIEENELGERRYVWRALGPDHYGHSMAYCILASHRVGVYEDRAQKRKLAEFLRTYRQEERYDPLSHGLDSSGAHYADELSFGCILQSGDSSQVSGTVSSPMADKAQYRWFKIKNCAHLLSPFINSPCLVFIF